MAKSIYAHIFNQEDCHPANLGSQILHDKFAALELFAQHTGQPFIIVQRFLVVFHAESLTRSMELGIKTVSQSWCKYSGNGLRAAPRVWGLTNVFGHGRPSAGGKISQHSSNTHLGKLFLDGFLDSGHCSILADVDGNG
jgi:hypothetical protein